MIVVECIPKSILDHGVDQNTVVHSVTITALHNCIRSERHILHTACDNDVSSTCDDLLSCHIHAVQTGTAYYVDGDCGNFYRKSCAYGSLSCHVLALACLDNTAHENFINLICRNAGALKSFLDHDRAKISSLNCAELSAHLTDCCTACARQNNFLCHFFPPISLNNMFHSLLR